MATDFIVTGYEIRNGARTISPLLVHFKIQHNIRFSFYRNLVIGFRGLLKGKYNLHCSMQIW